MVSTLKENWYKYLTVSQSLYLDNPFDLEDRTSKDSTGQELWIKYY
jgi:hypothetical protein